MLYDNNKILLYKKIFNLKNKQNKFFLHLLISYTNLLKNKFEKILIKFHLDQKITNWSIQRRLVNLRFLIFLYKKLHKILKKKKNLKYKNNNFILSLQNKFYFENIIKNEKIILNINKYVFIYIQNNFLLILLNIVINNVNFKNFYNYNIQNNFNILKLNLKIKNNIKNNILYYLNNKYKIFIKILLLNQTNIFLKIKKVKNDIFYMMLFNKKYNDIFFQIFYKNILIKNIKNNILFFLILLNISKFSFKFNNFLNLLNINLLKNYYIYNNVNMEFNSNLLFYTIIHLNNNQLKKKIIYYKNEYNLNIENLNEHLTVNLLENIQQNKNILNYNFQNFSIGEENPQNMSLNKYLKFLNRKTTLSLIDRRGLIHRFFDLNVKKFYETNFKIVKFGYLINIDSIKLWIISFQQLLHNFIKGNLKGLELLILCGFNFKEKFKLKKLLITYLIVRQNTQNVIYNHKKISKQNYLIFLNNYEKKIIKKNEIINKNIIDNNFLDQIFFLSVMSVKFIIENFIENEIRYDSKILEINRRNWYRNELYKLYRISIFNLSKEVFRNSFIYFIDFCYYKNLNGLSLNVIPLKFKFIIKFILPSIDTVNMNNIFFYNNMESIIKNFRMNQKLFCNKFRFRYLRSYQHIFLKNKYKHHLSLNVLMDNLINKNENIYFFFNIIKQLNLTLISHIYICQFIFFRSMRVLQELRLLHFESFYLNKMNLSLTLRNQFPDVYVFILNVLLFLGKNNLAFYNKFWNDNFKNNEVKNDISTFKHNTFKHNTFKHNIFKHNTFKHNTFKYNTFKHNTFKHNYFKNNKISLQSNDVFGLKKYILNLYYTNSKKKKNLALWSQRVKQFTTFCKRNNALNNVHKEKEQLRYNTNIKFTKKKLVNSKLNYKNIIKVKEIKKKVLLNCIELKNLIQYNLSSKLIKIKINIFKINKLSKLNKIKLNKLNKLNKINKLNKLKPSRFFAKKILKIFLNHIKKYRYFLFMNEICNIIFKSDKFYLNNVNYINIHFYKHFLNLSNYSYAIFGKSKSALNFNPDIILKAKPKFKLRLKSKLKSKFKLKGLLESRMEDELKLKSEYGFITKKKFEFKSKKKVEFKLKSNFESKLKSKFKP